MCRNSVLFHNEDHITILVTDVEPPKVVTEMVNMVHFAH